MTSLNKGKATFTLVRFGIDMRSREREMIVVGTEDLKIVRKPRHARIKLEIANIPKVIGGL
jgi:hypothetical protein